MSNQSIAPRCAKRIGRASMGVCALAAATLLAACSMPRHLDASAPPSDPFNPAATQLLDDTSWELTNWKSADGHLREVPRGGTGGEPLTIDFSTASGQRRVSGFSGCNQYAGRYELKNGALSLGPLVVTRMACPAAGGELEKAYLDALAHIEKSGVQMRPPQEMQLFVKDGITLTFARRGQ